MRIWRQSSRPFHTKRFLKAACSAGCMFCWMSVYSISYPNNAHGGAFCHVSQSFWNPYHFLKGKLLFPKESSRIATNSLFAEIKLWSQIVDNIYCWMKALSILSALLWCLFRWVTLMIRKGCKKFCCNLDFIPSIML